MTQSSISHGVIKEEEREDYEYAIHILLLTVLSYGSMLVIGGIFGFLSDALLLYLLGTVLFMVFYKVLRHSAGGAHSKSPLVCYCISIGSFFFIGGVPVLFDVERLNTVLLLLVVPAAIILLVFAPQPHENKPASENEMNYYRKRTRVMLCVEILCFLAGAGLRVHPVLLYFALCGFHMVWVAVLVKVIQDKRLRLSMEKST